MTDSAIALGTGSTTQTRRGGGRTSMLSPERREELSSFLRTNLSGISTPGAKHARMQHAIRNAIVSGVLKPGDQLPPEQEIADGVGLSLGTVRRCLANLARDGVVSRQHGRGTFVAGLTLTENEAWHIRFFEDDLETIRPIYQRVLQRRLVSSTGPWAERLGPSEAGYVQIERAVNVDSVLVCFSDFYLPADRFGEVMDMTTHDIESIGIKHIMALRFHVPIVRVRKMLRTLAVPDTIANVIRAAPGETVNCLEIVGFDVDDTPVSFQQIWIPKTDLPLDLSPPTQR